MLEAGQTAPEFEFSLNAWLVAGMPPVHKGQPQQLLRTGERLQ
jgi:hypothetical protein